MGPSPHLWFCAFKTAKFTAELQVSVGPRPRLWICECKTACLAPEGQVNIGSNPHLWFLHAEQRLLFQTYKSVWVPDLTCRCLHAKQRD